MTALAFLALGAACTPPGRPAGTSFVVAGCEPVDLIPQNQVAVCDAWYMEILFTGLTEEDRKTGEPVNVVARSVTSDDQLTWTIKLHDGWTFHNGEPLTAHSFVDAWNWAALQTNHSVANSAYSGIEGYEELNPGQGKQPTATTMSGLKVLDRLTFQVTLTEPNDFEGVWWVGLPWDPLPRAFFRHPEAWREMPIGDGPYQLDGQWKHDVAINFKRYPGYAGTPGLADRIQFRIYEGSYPFPDLERGLIDVVSVVQAQFLEAARKEFGERVIERPTYVLGSIYFPLYDPRFRNKALRQALSLAIDRDAITSEIRQGTASPATSMFPSLVIGHRDDACQYCRLDIPLARKKLAASGWKGTLDLYAFAGNPQFAEAEAVAEGWRKNLGLDVAVHELSEASLLERGGARAFSGPFWEFDIGDQDPAWWLDNLFKSNSDLNWLEYSNTQVDRLIAAGHAAATPSEAISDYQQAEDIILEELPTIPLDYPQQFLAYSKRLSGVRFCCGGLLALERIRVVG